MSDTISMCNMDERTNEEKLMDSKIEALIYELCPNTSRAWIYEENLPEKIRLLIRHPSRNDTLDEAIEAVRKELAILNEDDLLLEVLENAIEQLKDK